MANKLVQVQCWQCGERIGDVMEVDTDKHYHLYSIGFRDDKCFCSDVCKAQYHRDNGSPDIHRELEIELPHSCGVCGVLFFVNGYAERGGERRPLYCSGKCRQKAYRLRKKQQ